MNKVKKNLLMRKNSDLISLRALRKIIENTELHYTAHAQEQMALRHILSSEIIEVILGEKAEIIEEYLDDKYSPSCLIYGTTLRGKILHIQANYQGVIITAYSPDLNKWHKDMKTRRK